MTPHDLSTWAERAKPEEQRACWSTDKNVAFLSH